MRKERIGFAMCGSFCTHEKALAALKHLTEEYETEIPIVSENAAFTDTRFGSSDMLLENLELLEQFGFGCEDFGDGTVLLRELPSDIDAADAAAAQA